MVQVFDGPSGRVDLAQAVDWLGEMNYQSLMIEAGSKLNWNALNTGVVDKIYFYYAPKILGGLQSLPVAGGSGKRRRVDALNFRNVQLHRITADEFADAVLLLAPGEAQIAVGMLSSVWLLDAVEDGQRRRARNLCRWLRLAGLPLN